jgi:serpin B
MDTIDVDAIALSAKRHRRRRRSLLAGAGSLVVVGAVVLAMTLTGRSPTTRPEPPLAGGFAVHERVGGAVQLVAGVTPVLAADPVAQAATARAEQAFTIALLQQAGAAAHDANVVLSPSSLAIALAMLQNGASGATHDQIAKALQTAGQTDGQQNAGWASLAADLSAAGAADGISVQSANSLWLQRGLQMNPAFMAAMGRSYQAGVWQVDFANALKAATESINSWTSRHTNGKITKLFDDGTLDPTTLLVLANAVYFKADWQSPFDANRTSQGQFTRANGTTAGVQFMSGEPGPWQLATSPQLDAVQLPYKGGRFAALLVMPKQQPLSEYVSGLTTAQLDGVVGSLSAQQAALVLPRVQASTYTELNSILKTMGMATAFTDSADFSRLSSTPTKVASVVQRDYLAVDEKGTEAAAVTGIQMQPSSAFGGPSLTFDHPFLFLVRDTRTGTVLFAAEIQDPTAG